MSLKRLNTFMQVNIVVINGHIKNKEIEVMFYDAEKLENKNDENERNKKRINLIIAFLRLIFIGEIKEQINSSSTCNKHKKSRSRFESDKESLRT